MTPNQLKDSLVGRQIYFKAARRDLPAQKGRYYIMDLKPHRYYTILAHEAGDTTALIVDDIEHKILILLDDSCPHLDDAFKWSLRGKPLSEEELENKIRVSSPIKKLHKKEYFAWRSARYSCYSPNHVCYADVGALGITVPTEWINSFATFLLDVGKAPENTKFVRIDKKANYSKLNCKWVLHNTTLASL